MTRRFVWTFLQLYRGVCLRSKTDGKRLVVWRFSAGDYQEVWSAMKKRSIPQNGGGQPHLAALESDLLGSLLGVIKHCAITEYDDGDPRKPGWITLRTFGSAWQLEAKDPDTCLALRVVENSLDQALQLLNLLLECDEAPWESDPWLLQQATKKRK